ncbi:MAG: fatty acid desaturase [Alphaproteobacteria bacterium]|nr:fatty acid desaturase [Alphaproteobacteria bacterium]
MRPTAHTARINDRDITVQPRETLLQAALREGIPFPNGCRVGGCGACKCRLAEGEVKELTETGYLLSAEELAQGYVLACQSTPRSDVRLQVELPERVAGQIVEQERLTWDITRLVVQLERPLAYKAGQFAQVSLSGVTRSYSFASPSREGGQVELFVRHVPGGRFSGRVHEEDLRGQAVQLEGPSGDCWLRPGEGPLLFVAGGSGLAPILAMLREAAAAGETRPTTLLFGAREQRDLYLMEEIAQLAARWGGPFRFVPVLSQAEDDAEWVGARGLVTRHIGAHLQPGVTAYLCGPPGMVDAGVDVLSAHGVSPDHIHVDRFAAQALPPQEEAEVAGFLHYAKFGVFHLIALLSILSLIAGGATITYGLLVVVALYILGDAVGGDDTTTPVFRHPGVLTGLLWGALPMLAALMFVSVWSVCDTDVLGFGAWWQSFTGEDALAARAATGFGHHVSAAVLTGLMIGLMGTIPAHELTHRTWDRASLLIGRWLLAFSFDTIFSIEHVYGHHRYVSTTQDPATAPRGRSVYAHVLISTVRGNVSAWEIERARLERKQLPVWSWHNAVLRGQLMSALLLGLAAAMGGLSAAAYLLVCGLWGKALLEIVNYMEHYGIVRDPADPVQPHHSWNTNRRVSSWSMFNLTRHSHHHAQGEVAYQDLRPYPDAPMMVSGYLTTIILTLIPPLWHHLMTPKVLEWDERFATPKERRLAAAASAASGMKGFAQRAPSALGVSGSA